MKRTLKLACRGRGLVSPNPLVGAVLVKEGGIVAEGYHHRYGDRHAEVEAIAAAQQDIRGSSLYVNLEPCSHQGKQPPCVSAIVESGISRVVVGTRDPNPRVNGNGIKYLRQHGIAVDVGVLEGACRELNAGFEKFIRTGLPLFTLKIAQTLDGRICGADGNSRWISSEGSRKYAHRMRAGNDAILVGVGTVLSDDPQLNVRKARGRDPYRVVLDSRLRTPLNSTMLNDSLTEKTFVATTGAADETRVRKVIDKGVTVWSLPDDHEGRVDMSALGRKLASSGMTSVLVEGGCQVFSSFLKSRLADRLEVFIAPKLLGSGLSALSDFGVSGLDESVRLRGFKAQRVGEDVLLKGTIEYSD